MFPLIKHIDDVLPHIADKPEIARIEKDGYTVLDYIYAGVSTFDNAFARECRGLKFDSQGNLIGRPFHKFFNLNETEETKFENQDWSQQLFIHNKWDGSMIHPALVNGELVFMTRKGVTDVALQAMSECEYDADEMIRHIRDGFTPIYEFISPNNKIVLHYDEARLVP
jgi:RNA ligase